MPTVAGYITKSEKLQTANVFDVFARHSNKFSQYLSLCLSTLRQREVGHYEGIDKLLSHPLHGR